MLLQVFDTSCTLVTFRVEVGPLGWVGPLAPAPVLPAEELAPELVLPPELALVPESVELPLLAPLEAAPVTATSRSTTSANFEVSP